MWDDIFAEVSGDVTGSASKKDDKGVTRTFKPTSGVPTGDILSERNWLDSAKGGGAITEKGKTESGVNVTRSVKELSGAQATRAACKLFGVAPPAKRGAKADTLPSLDDASKNGAPVS